jgi:DNA-directed RNA polymerase subunit RPC12/RpoP
MRWLYVPGVCIDGVEREPIQGVKGSTRTYTMQRKTMTRIERTFGTIQCRHCGTRITVGHGTIQCRHCGTRITVGQAVVSKHHGTRRKQSLKLYHTACYDETLY